MTEELVPFELIEPNPENVRKTYNQRSIAELADNIEENGLIENLVGFRVAAVFHSEEDSRAGRSVKVSNGHRVRLRAGHRRYYAIQKLIESGKWPKDRPVRVSIDPNMTASRDALVNISENVHQEALYPWELGQTYCDLIDRGWKQSEIADRVGKHQTTVSNYVVVARGLHPKIKEKLTAIPSANIPNITKLIEIARLIDRMSDTPDLEKQERALEKIMFAPKAPKRSAAERAGTAFFASRLRQLEAKISEFPPDSRDFLSGVLRFISGETDDFPTWPHPSRQKAAPPRSSPSRATSSSRDSGKRGKTR